MRNFINYSFAIELCKKFLPVSARIFLKHSSDNLFFLIERIRRNGLLKTCREVLPVFFYNLAAVFISVPLGLIIFTLAPVVKIRLVRLLSERIGHFALNTEIMLCAFDEGELNKSPKSKVKYMFYTHRIVSNQQLLRMWKRILPVLPSPIICSQINKILSFVSEQYRNDSLKKMVEKGSWADDRFRLMERVSRPHVFFTDKEDEKGRALMKKLGIPPNARYVCLAVRDSIYLDKLIPGNVWSYHDHRNAVVMSYKQAALFLAKKGYYVIRMGKWVKDNFKVPHSNVIDYANHELRSDFLDIYLSSRCYFFISTSTGIDGTAQLFRRPLVFTNVSVPSELQRYSKNSLFIPKKLKNKNSNKFLKFNEVSNVASFPDRALGEIFQNKDLDLIDNTENEVEEIVKEMLYRLQNTWQEGADDCTVQKQFFNDYYSQDVKNFADINVKVGRNFLAEHKYLLSQVGGEA